MENKVSRNFLSSKSIAFKIAFCAIFVALLTVTNFFSYQISEIFELSFVMAVSFFAGLILDVPLSFMVGFLADMLGHFISPKGPYNIFINISSGLFCAIPALLYFIVNKVLNKNNNFLSFIFILSTSFILYYVFCSVFLNSIGLWIISNSWAQKNYGTFWGMLTFRAIASLLNYASNIAVVIMLYFPLKRIKYFKDVL